MLRPILVSAVAALALTFIAPTSEARAQEGGDAAKVKTYDFSGDTIDGDLLKPDGDMINTRNFASHSSLIRIRRDFIKEILKSADDV